MDVDNNSGNLMNGSYVKLQEDRIENRGVKFFFETASGIGQNPILRENLPIITLVAVYILTIYVLHAFWGISGKIVLKFYFSWYAQVSILLSSVFLLIHLLKKSYKQYVSPSYLSGFIIVFLLTPLFASAFASFKQTIPLIHDFSWDITFMKLDYILHFGHHPWRLLMPVLNNQAVLLAVDFLYMLWFLCLIFFSVWMAWTQRRRLRLHYFISTLLVWSLLGSGLGTLFSSAGPCYYSQMVSAGNNPFNPLMAKLFEIHQTTPLWAVINQVGLWQAKVAEIWLPFGGISAMPSIHLAMATIFVLLTLRVNRYVGVVFIGYLLIIQIGSVILGWHYAVDGYAGIILAYLIWIVVGRMIGKQYNEPPMKNV